MRQATLKQAGSILEIFNSLSSEQINEQLIGSGILHDLVKAVEGGVFLSERREEWQEMFGLQSVNLLTKVIEVAVNGTSRFVAADFFGPDNPDGIKFYLGENFKKHFLGKVEEGVEAATIAVHRLENPSRDPEIMTELGEEKRVITLTHFYEMFTAQSEGQEGPLLVNGYANIAYIEDEDGTLWAVRARWYLSRREWSVRARAVARPFEWPAGFQVFSPA